MARAKKPEETSATTEETTPVVETAAETTPETPTQEQIENIMTESLQEAGLNVERTDTPPDFILAPTSSKIPDDVVASLNAHMQASMAETTPEAPAPLSDRAAAAPWIPTHRVITENSTYLTMVTGSLAWTHPEYDSTFGEPSLARVSVSGDWLPWRNPDGSEFSGKVVSLDPSAPDRHTHRREPFAG